MRFNLVVRLVLGPAPRSVAKSTLDVEPGQTVRVNLQAPAFEILTAPWQEIDVPPGQDSAPAVFDLQPRETGPQALELDFFQAGHPLGMVTVPVEVVEQPIPEAQAQAQARASVLSLASEAPSPDRVLRIAWDPERSTLVFTLIQGASLWEFPLRVQRDPAAWADHLFKDLNDLTVRFEPTARDLLGEQHSISAPSVEERLKLLGQNLWNELPAEFRSLYARERDRWRDGSLLIYSDEPHLPWELVWPYGESWEDPDPWCLTLCLSRWLRRSERGNGNLGPPDRLPLTTLASVVPSDANLPAAQRERAFLRQLLGQRGVRDVSPPEPTWAAIMDLLRSSPYDWFHATTHGNFSTEAPDQHSALWLYLPDGPELLRAPARWQGDGGRGRPSGPPRGPQSRGSDLAGLQPVCSPQRAGASAG